uniref:Secreted protein n=1 Tax=Elaeophora elaphi TaxID=1147741 RepID=A0A0R3S3Z7_9BILA
MLLPPSLLFAITILNLHYQTTDATYDTFFRSPKLVNLGPSGGSLVSGRGNFRPGFSSSASDSRFYMSEPLFAFKVGISEF